MKIFVVRIVGLVVCGVMVLQAQDFHFSQFYNAPIITNAANTGRLHEDFRINVLHRSQWQVVTQPFSSSFLASDVNLYKKILGSKKQGIGLFVMNDQVGFLDGRRELGTILQQYAVLSYAQHYTLDDESHHHLSLGIQAGVSIRSLSTDNLIFRNQIDPSTNQANSNLTSGEDLRTTPLPGVQANLGAFYEGYLSKKISLFVGLSGFNLVPKNESMFISTNVITPIRYSLQAGVYYRIHPKWLLTPQIMLQTQALARSWMAGTNVSYVLFPGTRKTNLLLSGGLWYRLQDAAIAYTGIQFNHVQIGFSYDFTTSRFNELWPVGSRYIQGGWELSLIYTGFLQRPIPNEVTIPCTVF